jgi:hypothetical protein
MSCSVAGGSASSAAMIAASVAAQLASVTTVSSSGISMTLPGMTPGK